MEEQTVMQSNNHLNPSELGTKEYWDALYNRELRNHGEDGEDEGTIWFDESNAEATVIRELDTLAEEGLLAKASSTFLDLGMGNGHMLFALRYPDDEDEDDDDDDGDGANPWTGHMVGVDYSAASVDLARRIAGQRHERDGQSDSAASATRLRFETWDLLTQPPGPWLATPPGTFDVVLDKGTFDAISLMPAPTGNSAAHPCTTYREKVTPLVREGGFLVVTSCNWTRDELVNWLAPSSKEGVEGEGKGLQFFREATYPSFTFGGRKGQSVVTVVFRRVAGS